MKKATPYWIIVNWKSRSIYQDPYWSFEEASKQLNKLNTSSKDWKIEQRESFQEVEKGDNGEDFSKF